MVSSYSAGSEKITAKDMMAVAKVNWEKLAARAGFKDGATARAHYEPLLNLDYPDDALGKKPGSKRVNTETLETGHGNNHDTRNRFTSCYSSDFEDGEV
ncbi:hypothetical protein E0Z10_g10578 [Xylaria hypoxylon]|uniref:Uncharacterized protein n=1 Tax=Xylaria hypoxylon TaxID=37992 RepID=A0A4Z0Y376_9PEZI|nr:hypothetical protein E0Z10_g10578 [Xylaria hypoxylon]